MYDLKNKPWKILVNTDEERKAVQEWLFSQGIGWCSGSKKVVDSSSFHKGYTNVMDDGTIEDNGFMWMSRAVDDDTPEIKLNFKTTLSVVSIDYPKVEYVEFNGKKYIKAELEKALSLINPV